MRSAFVVVSLSCLVGSLVVACGAARTPDGGAATPSSSAASDAGAPRVPEAGAKAERPFAGSAQEATQLISDIIDRKTDAIARCVKEYRQRKHLAHERVEISVGIDQEGNVLGVTLPKGKKDDQLAGCVMDVLRGASFPRSHAGVITMTKSYEEVVQ